MSTFTGTLPALITPFRDDEVDVAALRELVERCIAGGCEGLVPCGTTGESVTLSEEEHALVVRTVVEQAKKRVPVVAGAGTVSTAHTIHLAEISRNAGADGLLLVCPYYNRPTQAGLEAHFRAVAKAVPLPTLLYNIPGRTGVDLALETFERLADVKAIVGIKEATGNVLRSQQIVARMGDRFDVLSGDDALTLPVLSVGGKGVISVTANLLPKETSDVVRLWNAGDVAGARALHLRLNAVHESMFVEANPGPVKAAIADAGHIAKEIRLPLVWPGEASVEKVRAALRAFRGASA
ncbi:4-hydroxy-tetrahydrodipicolinate synthase [Sandaracinus amylolyticus]|uniref:4-hydroxy-tetrahydrodipicolinate synthase n=1 Tax=Sandaracinus amylolyticus TaxID=927083 RepID=UPI001F002785|nr:4-hydroxy-tetrahydrodipicolinate synthase [Sandaracinus amylolyticus]UJR82068.1 4-hydroxy-tetrahydrodipicolinate synthase [Sandaracinus amylolyticus]